VAGDGVSLQTNIAQLGNVAKTQARGQQAGGVAPGQAPTRDEDVQPLQKVRETEKSEKEKLDPEARRERDRRRRQAGDPAAGDDEADGDDEENPDGREAPHLGGLIDTKA